MDRLMITLEYLQQLALSEMARYEELSKAFPPGTINDMRNDALRNAETAELCAQHMVNLGVTELAHVGPYHSFEVQRDQIVRIKKGALVFSTHPSFDSNGKVTARHQQVKVHAFDRGYVTTYGPKPNVVPPFVRWAGTGGYWRWTDLNNVELISES